jgi:hypothetical protein
MTVSILTSILTERAWATPGLEVVPVDGRESG